MDITPEDQFAGRGVSFALSGLPPWLPVTVSFIDPHGIAASWITTEDVRLVDRDGAEATYFIMYPDASGELDWERYAIQDEAGDWSVDIDLDGNVSSIAYALDEMPLFGQDTVSIGEDLSKNSGPDFAVYYSDLVPAALVVDLQDHLSDSAVLMEQRTGIATNQLPDLYLMGDREIMERVGVATGIQLGFEDGYYKSFGARPGIYMRTDLQSTQVRRLLVHEYVHLIFDALANERTLPAWLTEGLSVYYEFDITLSGPRANASQRQQFRAADLARAAAQQGTLFSLIDLDSQADWNARSDQDQIALQYAEAYMAVRYLNETYGLLSGKRAVEEIGRGSSLRQAIETVTGSEFDSFEPQFRRWLADWEDPTRASIAEYLAAFGPVLADLEAILTQRSKNAADPVFAGQAAIRRVALVNSTEAVIVRLQGLSPPEGALALHQEAEGYFGRVFDWLTLEFQHADTLDDTKRIAANDMIPEINTREFLLQRNTSDLQFVLHLRD